MDDEEGRQRRQGEEDEEDLMEWEVSGLRCDRKECFC